jgi:hypothetical protein
MRRAGCGEGGKGDQHKKAAERIESLSVTHFQHAAPQAQAPTGSVPCAWSLPDKQPDKRGATTRLTARLPDCPGGGLKRAACRRAVGLSCGCPGVFVLCRAVLSCLLCAVAMDGGALLLS